MPDTHPAGPLKTPHAARYNLRDYGGYAARDGARLRRGVLLRSAQLDGALPGDEGLVARLGVAAVVDLRGESEVGHAPPPAFDGYAGPIHFAASADGLIPHAMRHLGHLQTPADVHARLTNVYANLPDSARFRESLAHYFAALAEAQGATLIHCFAGKDRTGLAVALFQLLAGVHADEVRAEYLLTNAMGDERVAAAAHVLQRSSDVPIPAWLLREAMGVRAAYLDTALAHIDAAHGGAAAYVAQATGLTPAALDGVVARWLA